MLVLDEMGEKGRERGRLGDVGRVGVGEGCW